MRVNLRIVPNAKSDAIVQWQDDGTLRVRLNAPAVEGKANAALVKFLASCCGVRKNQVTLVSGEKNRLKVVEIAGLPEDDFRRRMNELIN